MRYHYETPEPDPWPDAVTVDGYKGIAWHVLGYQTEPDEDTEWSGIEERTGMLVCRMVGDDRHFLFEPDEIAPLNREEYCGVCGQIGCCHDGLDREDEE